MNPDNFRALLAMLTDLSRSGVLIYFIYSLRVYLTARDEKLGVRPVFERRVDTTGGHDATQA